VVVVVVQMVVALAVEGTGLYPPQALVALVVPPLCRTPPPHPPPSCTVTPSGMGACCPGAGAGTMIVVRLLLPSSARQRGTKVWPVWGRGGTCLWVSLLRCLMGGCWGPNAPPMHSSLAAHSPLSPATCDVVWCLSVFTQELHCLRTGTEEGGIRGVSGVSGDSGAPPLHASFAAQSPPSPAACGVVWCGVVWCGVVPECVKLWTVYVRGGGVRGHWVVCCLPSTCVDRWCWQMGHSTGVCLHGCQPQNACATAERR
jgi:hypothetical protein